jgi:hypothetical protein
MVGAGAQVNRHIPLMTYGTCPIRRYHPAVVAQKAATMPLLPTAGPPSASAVCGDGRMRTQCRVRAGCR